jgi:TRAP-type mannitol/chloroaromatic compound transport system permease small subunit
MLRVLVRFSQLINRLNEWVGRAVAWLTTVLVLMFCYDVVTRYVFNYSNVAMFELEWHLFAVIFLAGAGYTLRHDRHVRVDVLYAKFSPRTKAWVNLLGTLFFLFPFSLVVFKGAWPYVAISFRIGEGSSDPGGLPYRFVIKSFMLTGFGLLFLQGLSMIAASLLTLAGGDARQLDRPLADLPK